MPFWDKLESDWTFTGEDYKGGIGSDKSHRYMKNKNSVLYIATDNNSQRVIALKPFIESFKINFNMKANESKNAFSGRIHKAPINMGATYSLSLVVPAASINEARMNKRKIELLPKFLESFDGQRRILVPKRHFLYLNNLIHNGKRISGNAFSDDENLSEVETYNNLLNYACGGFLSEANYSIKTDDGFFEYEGKLFPKTYAISLSFIAFNEQKTINGKKTSHYLTDGYSDAGGSSTKSIENWPFGVKITNVKQNKISSDSLGYNFLSDNGFGYDHAYTKNKNSYIYIFAAQSGATVEKWKKETNRILAFKPYLDSFSFSRKTTNKEEFASFSRTDVYAFPADDATYDLTFNVLAENVSESIAMHGKLQELIRMISPTAVVDSETITVPSGENGNTTVNLKKYSYSEKKQDNYIRILFSNLIFNRVRYKDNISNTDHTGYLFEELNDNIFVKSGDLNESDHYDLFFGAAAPFNLTEISYEPFIEMGFFEYDQMLWAKGYKLSLKLSENYTETGRSIVYKLASGNILNYGE